MDNQKFARSLEKRTKQFAISIIGLIEKLPTTVAGRVIAYQLAKSGTSVGANYREANRAVSKDDFRNKISICVKEASETQYWLEIILEAKVLVKPQVQTCYQECTELLSIFTAVWKKTKVA